MSKHGTTLTDGQSAEFVGAGTKTLVLIQNELGPNLAHLWAGKSELMQSRFLEALTKPIESEILEFLGTVTLPARTEQFVGKIEEPTSETTLRHAKDAKGVPSAVDVNRITGSWFRDLGSYCRDGWYDGR